MRMCSVSVQEAGGWGGGWGLRLMGSFVECLCCSPSHSHEMGKHEIKVEKTHKRVEGG